MAMHNDYEPLLTLLDFADLSCQLTHLSSLEECDVTA